MKTGWTWVTTALLTGAISMGACGGKKASEESEGAEAASGGEPALVITDQAEWDSLLASGKDSYDETCGNCHPGGDADVGPKIAGHEETSAKMTKQIRKGSGRMAPIGTDKLPEDQMKGLLVYLSSIGAVGDVKGP